MSCQFQYFFFFFFRTVAVILQLGDFLKFLEIENVQRDLWPRQATHGQEVHKHMVVNMIQSKLFKKSADGLYSRTAKGLLYTDFINLKIDENEKWFINYLFLLNGYYFSRKNYIIYRVKEDLLGYLLSVDGLDEPFLIEKSKDLLLKESFREILRDDFFYIHSFYNDSDFLIKYLRSSAAEREELAAYIEDNLARKNYVCCISSKYRSGGNFLKGSLLDETRVFLMTLLFIQSKVVNASNVYNIFVENFIQNISEIDRKKVLKYLYNNQNVFDPIFSDILELDEVETATSEIFEEGGAPEIEAEEVPEEYIDETSEAGKQKIKAIYALRKRQARIQSGFKCGLETINNCSSIYFTAKVSGKNYLELHHFIPREFRNDFSHSIEVLANYVTLCPRCHRQIHLATDRERKHLINSLFEARKDRLELVGLKMDLKGIYQYYKIDS